MVNDKVLFDKSLEHWGLRSQLMMLAEESAELTVEACHFQRQPPDKQSIKKFAEEIADVSFMIDEFLYYFTNTFMKDWDMMDGESLVKKVARYRELKRVRLAERLGLVEAST